MIDYASLFRLNLNKVLENFINPLKTTENKF